MLPVFNYSTVNTWQKNFAIVAATVASRYAFYIFKTFVSFSYINQVIKNCSLQLHVQGGRNGTIFVYLIISPNINRFSKFFTVSFKKQFVIKLSLFLAHPL